jgi:hypothetical protein
MRISSIAESVRVVSDSELLVVAITAESEILEETCRNGMQFWKREVQEETGRLLLEYV